MATEARETVDLIGSDKVEGTAVYDAKGERMGTIKRVMLEKRSGQVAYAVLSFGGFLGLGSDSYPIPWDALKYDTSLGGYRINITEQQLKVRQNTRAIPGTGKITKASPQGLRLLQHAVDRTLIAHWLAGCPQDGWPWPSRSCASAMLALRFPTGHTPAKPYFPANFTKV